MRALLINADDFGLTDGVSRAIAELLESRAISNTTIMICVEGAENCCKRYLTSDISKYAGVHLQTTPECHHNRPLSPASEIPTLVDAHGYFKPIYHEDWVNPDEVRLEWERQIIKTAEVLGHKPSHMDSHHGTHRRESLTPIYLELAAKYKIPVRGGWTLNQVDGSKLGVKSSALSNSDWTGQNKSLQELKISVLQLINSLNEGVPEIVVHPGFYDEELRVSSTWNEVRQNDYQILKELHEEKWLQSQGINLISFADLK